MARKLHKIPSVNEYESAGRFTIMLRSIPLPARGRTFRALRKICRRSQTGNRVARRAGDENDLDRAENTAKKTAGPGKRFQARSCSTRPNLFMARPILHGRSWRTSRRMNWVWCLFSACWRGEAFWLYCSSSASCGIPGLAKQYARWRWDSGRGSALSLNLRAAIF